MQRFPMIAADAEDTDPRERAVRRLGGRWQRPDRRLAERTRRWHRTVD